MVDAHEVHVAAMTSPFSLSGITAVTWVNWIIRREISVILSVRSQSVGLGSGQGVSLRIQHTRKKRKRLEKDEVDADD